jgi:hypothetical protein
MTNPWEGIARPESSATFNREIVDDVQLKNFYWSRDSLNQCCLAIFYEENYKNYLKKEHLDVEGINIDYLSTKISQYNTYLVIKLKDNSDLDIFYSFCMSLIQKIGSANAYERQLIITLNHLIRWKNFMATSKNRNLSANQIQGLFCELSFLDELLGNKKLKSVAVDSWVGMDKPPAPQDFIFNDTAIDIKSILGDERKRVKISSEDQLDADKKNLFLKIYSISKVGPEHGVSLNQMVDRIYKLLNNDVKIDIFDKKLSTANYVSKPEYDEDHYLINNESEKNYIVSDGFPCLKKSDLAPMGIEKVTYSIRLESIKNFECDREKLLE